MVGLCRAGYYTPTSGTSCINFPHPLHPTPHALLFLIDHLVLVAIECAYLSPQGPNGTAGAKGQPGLPGFRGVTGMDVSHALGHQVSYTIQLGIEGTPKLCSSLPT